jgi:hypothetical protein
MEVNRMPTAVSLVSPLADTYMPPELSPEMRDIVISIRATAILEERLPLLNSIREIETERVHTMRLAQWAEAKGSKIDPATGEFYNWAVRVGMMCHRRVQQLLKGQKTLPEKDVNNAPVLPLPPFASPAPDLESEPETAKPKKTEEEILRVMEKVRKDTKAKGENLSETAIRKRAVDRLNGTIRRSRRNKKRAAESPKKYDSPSDHFRSYWVKEKKLLNRFFTTAELAVIANYWWREFHTYRMAEEKILSDNRQERERRKALAELTKP